MRWHARSGSTSCCIIDFKGNATLVNGHDNSSVLRNKLLFIRDDERIHLFDGGSVFSVEYIMSSYLYFSISVMKTLGNEYIVSTFLSQSIGILL